jgi:hypothetical protein
MLCFVSCKRSILVQSGVQHDALPCCGRVQAMTKSAAPPMPAAAAPLTKNQKKKLRQQRARAVKHALLAKVRMRCDTWAVHSEGLVKR